MSSWVSATASKAYDNRAVFEVPEILDALISSPSNRQARDLGYDSLQLSRRRRFTVAFENEGVVVFMTALPTVAIGADG